MDIYNIQRVNAFHKTEMGRNKPKKFFVHDNSTHSISLIKDFNTRRPIYV